MSIQTDDSVHISELSNFYLISVIGAASTFSQLPQVVTYPHRIDANAISNSTSHAYTIYISYYQNKRTTQINAIEHRSPVQLSVAD